MRKLHLRLMNVVRSQPRESSDRKIVDGHDAVCEKKGINPYSFKFASADGSFLKEQHFLYT